MQLDRVIDAANALFREAKGCEIALPPALNTALAALETAISIDGPFIRQETPLEVKDRHFRICIDLLQGLIGGLYRSAFEPTLSDEAPEEGRHGWLSQIHFGLLLMTKLFAGDKREWFFAVFSLRPDDWWLNEKQQAQVKDYLLKELRLERRGGKRDRRN